MNDLAILCICSFLQQQQQMLSAGRAQLVRGSLHSDLSVSATAPGHSAALLLRRLPDTHLSEIASFRYKTKTGKITFREMFGKECSCYRKKLSIIK